MYVKNYYLKQLINWKNVFYIHQRMYSFYVRIGTVIKIIKTPIEKNGKAMIRNTEYLEVRSAVRGAFIELLHLNLTTL